MTTGDTKYVVALKEGNYATWKIQCRMALMKDNLWTIVSETEVAPVDGADEAVVAKFRARADRALAVIVLTIDPSLLYLLGDPDSPVEVWKKLESQFQKKSWANKLVLRRKLHSVRLRQGESVQKHIKVLTEVFNELAIIGAPMDAEDQVIHLLSNLPESYDTLVTALESSAEVPQMEVVIDRLLYEEKKIHIRQCESGVDDTALASRQAWKKSVRCHYCQKLGHMQKDCFERERKSDVTTQKSSQRSFKPKSRGTGMIVLTHALTAGNHVNSWIIDSGATSHICCNKSMFDTLESLDAPQAILLGDSRTVECTQQGVVKLEMTQKNGTFRSSTLSDVLFVPALSYNLLSVTKATMHNKIVRFNQQECVIVDEYGDTLCSATKVGNLYYLKCKLEKSQVQKVHVTSTQGNIEKWHRR